MNTSDANGYDLAGARASEDATRGPGISPNEYVREEPEQAEPNQLTGEEEAPLTSWAEPPLETYAEWPPANERRPEDEEWLAAQEPAALEAEEEWTAGMDRPQQEAEEPEWEEEPLGQAAKPQEDLEEAEADDRYGV